MPTFTKIADYTVPSATHSVTISAIPNTYTDLMIKCAMRSDYGANHEGQFILNSITSSDYTQTLALGENTGVPSYGPTNSAAATWALIINGSSSTANTFSNINIYLSNYANTNIQKSWTMEGGVGNLTATAQGNYMVGGFCNTTAAVSSITFFAWQTFINFVAGSTFQIYGISNA